MAKRLYLCPQVWAGDKLMAWRPKTLWAYGKHTGPCLDYGHQGYVLVVADLSEVEHQAAEADSEIFCLPLNLDAAIGGNVATVHDALEAMKMPADWVQATHTYRQVMRLIYAAIILFRRVAGILNTTVPFLAGTITLETRFNELPQVGRDALIQFAQERNLDYTGVTPTVKLRQIIKGLAEQLPSKSFGGIVL